MSLSNYVLEYETGASADPYTYDTFDEAKTAAAKQAQDENILIQVIEQEFEYADSSLVWDTESGPR